MTIPTVASLCSALGHHLVPEQGFTAPDTEISAVHISELVDPNAYLSGGELLLTTGLALPRSEIGCRRYVARLAQAEVSALALGLGPVHDAPPAPLVNACREAGLPLLVVPAPTPFLLVSRTYWAARARSTEQQLTDAVAAHRALVDAAVAPDPGAAILRRLAVLLEGWAALLTAQGKVDQSFPAGLVEEMEALQAEVGRLEVAGVHSSASFSSSDHVVVVFPLSVEGRIVGYLAAGSPRQLDPAQRRVVLTAAALLSLDAVRHQRSQSAREATRRCVALLVDDGLADAARRLATATGVPPPPREVSVLAVRGRDSNDLVGAVERWCPEALSVMVDRGAAWCLLPAGHGGLDDLEAALAGTDPTAAAVVSGLVAVEAAGAARPRTQRALEAVAPGELVRPRPTDGVVPRAVDRFLVHAGPEQLQALVGYLRHRGQYEAAAKALALHRNTLRYRVARARELLGLELDDPDVFAETWLALRSRGAA